MKSRIFLNCYCFIVLLAFSADLAGNDYHSYRLQHTDFTIAPLYVVFFCQLWLIRLIVNYASFPKISYEIKTNSFAYLKIWGDCTTECC